MTQANTTVPSDLDAVQLELAATLNDITLLDAALDECDEINQIYFSE